MSSEIKKLSWTKVVSYFWINAAIAGMIFWSGNGGPAFIEFLFPTVLGIIYTVFFMLVAIGVLVIWLLGSVRKQIKDSLKKQSRKSAMAVWHPLKRTIGVLGSALIIVACAQAGWGYIMTIAILTMLSSHTMINQIKGLHEEAWKDHVDVVAEDGHIIEANLIIKKDLD